MRLTIVQSALVWENKAENLRRFDQKLAPLVGQTDLVVLPEMFSTGFSMKTGPLAEDMGGPTVAWLAEKAAQLGAVVTGSFICHENGLHHNRLVWMRPDGTFDTYDKRHLFSLAEEEKHFAPGRKRLIVSWKGFAVCPMICYDLRFPVWSRNRRGEAGYDLLIYMANWPVRRSHHWRALLQARAIENQAYCVGLNIVGADGNGLEYVGDSAVIDCSGQHLCQLAAQEGVFTTEISLDALRNYRTQFPFLADADAFQVLGSEF